MSDDEILTTTRTRRANAGSRLKHLIDMEGESTEQKTTVSQFINEEDDNVDLLFAEGDNDDEFVGSEEQSSGEEDEDEDGDNENEETKQDVEQGEEDDDDDDDDDEDDGEPVNPDDVLSDSDISLSDTDESEGEKELESQEKQKKRKLKQKNRMVPAIKKFKSNDNKPKKSKPKTNLVTSNSLLLDARRSSSRASAIENKEALVEKLKDDERRTSTAAPRVRPKFVEKTQEEKLAEAVETEKANILSLEMFKEQEVVKKERQKQLLMLKRKKLTEVIRVISKEEYISPLQEIHDARNLFYKLTSKSRKRNIRKVRELMNMDLTKLPGDIDRELPYYKAELEKQKINGNYPDRINGADQNGVDQNGADQNGADQNGADQNGADRSENDQSEGDAESVIKSDRDSNLADKGPDDSNGDISNGLSSNDHSITTNQGKEKSPDAVPISNKESNDDNNENTEDKEIIEKIENDAKKEKKKVTFAEDSKPSNHPEGEMMDKGVDGNDDDNEDEDEDEDVSRDQSIDEPESVNGENPIFDEVFEGPVQRVARNMVYLVEFGDSRINLYDTKVKQVLFGEEATLPASRRFKDLKTIFKIGGAYNPYTKVKEQEDELFKPADDLKHDDPMFGELNRLPKLGIRQEIIEEEDDDTGENDAVITLNTEAPTGLYLPNGNKKYCLITGSEVKYFDPSTGIPYSDVETFKFLKSMEQGTIPWYTFDELYNDTGATEVYLGSRDGSVRHARGVPEGFDS